tara:strand:+ start:754 stop:1149 length:396 start_codon:yes stop_codon:yes gene_type:complete
MKFHLILKAYLLLIFIIGCKPANELTMERGVYFYQAENYSSAADQFNQVILSYSSNLSSLSIYDIEILAHAYQQLSLCQAKLAQKTNNQVSKNMYYSKAIENIKKAESIAIKQNKREEYRKTHLGLIHASK